MSTGAEELSGPGEEPTGKGRPGRIRSRLSRTNADLDLRNTWQVAAGALLLPLGIGIIVIGWNGAAHGRVVQQQLPYLISGGLVGLAVVIIGCFFYWAHWLYRLYDQAGLHHQQMLEEQREMMRALLEAVAARPAAAGENNLASPAAPQGAVPAATNGSGRTFVATATGSNFHQPGCAMVANRAGSVRVISEEEAGQMKPCRVCEPLSHSTTGS